MNILLLLTLRGFVHSLHTMLSTPNLPNSQLQRVFILLTMAIAWLVSITMALFVGILEFFATNVLFLFLYNCTFRTHSLQTLHTYLRYIPFFATVSLLFSPPNCTIYCIIRAILDAFHASPTHFIRITALCSSWHPIFYSTYPTYALTQWHLPRRLYLVLLLLRRKSTICAFALPELCHFRCSLVC